MKSFFNMEELGTNYKNEIIGGLTTFLSMAYILAVNPSILSLAGIDNLPEGTGMDAGAVFVATSIAAFIGCMVMGLLANYPIALAPGVGINAFFAYSVVLTMGIPWQTALTGVLMSGIIFALLTLSGLRELIINAIPLELKLAVSAGIGLFITFVGLQNSNLIVNNDNTLVGLGDFYDPLVLLTVAGIVITVILMALKINGGIFIGMVATALIGLATGLIDLPSSVVGAVPSLEPTFGKAFEAFQTPSEIFNMQFLIVILTFLFIDFFDTAGTLVAVASAGGLMKGNVLPRAGKALFSDCLLYTSPSPRDRG